jgi:hypothetical protein
MQAAYVVRLGPETDIATGRFEGCVEEVDTGKELRFKSAAELLAFLGQCYQQASNRRRELKSAPHIVHGTHNRT